MWPLLGFTGIPKKKQKTFLTAEVLPGTGASFGSQGFGGSTGFDAEIPSY